MCNFPDDFITFKNLAWRGDATTKDGEWFRTKIYICKQKKKIAKLYITIDVNNSDYHNNKDFPDLDNCTNYECFFLLRGRNLLSKLFFCVKSEEFNELSLKRYQQENKTISDAYNALARKLHAQGYHLGP